MFVVQALTTTEQFSLFQNLASHGTYIIKYPLKKGKPVKILFRFSFVEGKIYLTWKGKFGNQGVDLSEVTHVSLGIDTMDSMNKSNNNNKESSGSNTALEMEQEVLLSEQFLSIICIGRSVDLCLDNKEIRDAWCTLLNTLCNKENGILINIPSILPPNNNIVNDCFDNYDNINNTILTQEDLDEWSFLYTAIGSTILPNHIKKYISGVCLSIIEERLDEEKEV